MKTLKKILIATPLYPPDIGGPATYSRCIKDEFEKHNLSVEIVSFDAVRHLPSGIRHLVYLYNILRKSSGSQMILALDAFSVGLPATIASKILRKKIVVRLGGDFLWEQAVEQRKYYGTLSAFYADKHIKKSFFLLRALIQYVVNHSDLIVFSTKFQKDIYQKHYNLSPSRITIIENALEKNYITNIQNKSTSNNYIFYAGRLIVLKNLEILISVFADPAFNEMRLILAGKGPEEAQLRTLIKQLKLDAHVEIITAYSSSEIAQHISDSLFCVLPSLSDVSPNFALECISQKKAIILTSQTGLRDYFPQLVFIDPMSSDDLKEKMILMLNADYRNDYELHMTALSSRSWDVVAKEFIVEFNKLGLSI
jgi:glycosyltransferase involved in cell wall biosynthesis